MKFSTSLDQLFRHFDARAGWGAGGDLEGPRIDFGKEIAPHHRHKHDQRRRASRAKLPAMVTVLCRKTTSRLCT